jgi:hypothetical protein
MGAVHSADNCDDAASEMSDGSSASVSGFVYDDGASAAPAPPKKNALFSPDPVLSPRPLGDSAGSAFTKPPKKSRAIDKENLNPFATPPRRMTTRSCPPLPVPQAPKPEPQSPLDGSETRPEPMPTPTSPIAQVAAAAKKIMKGRPSGKIEEVKNNGTPVVSNANTKWAGDKRVYVVDEASGVFVFDLLTSTECDDIVAGAEKHISTVGNDSSKNWRKLYTYTKMDLPMDDLDAVDAFKGVKEKLMTSICTVIGGYYGCNHKLLRPRTWKEPHLLKYTFDSPVPHCGVEVSKRDQERTPMRNLSFLSNHTTNASPIRCTTMVVTLRGT